MGTNISFENIAGNLFEILAEQGYFDFYADYSKNEQSISLTMHRNSYRYNVWLKTDISTIWSETVQLAFLIALENLSDVDVAAEDYSFENMLQKFQLSGYTNIKTMTPVGTITVSGTFERHRIICKITYKDISEQIIAMRARASLEAQRTGIYHEIDPRYRAKESELQPIDVCVEKDFDTMDGYQFELFCSELLSRNGYRDVFVTKSSGDQGIDIISYKAGKKYGIQCKCYSSAVGNKAVMEVYAGISYYGCETGIVLTNSYFTPAAKDMAKRTGIILWDRTDLLRLVEHAALG